MRSQKPVFCEKTGFLIALSGDISFLCQPLANLGAEEIQHPDDQDDGPDGRRGAVVVVDPKNRTVFWGPLQI